MWFDEGIPSLEEIDSMGMYLEIFAAIHASAYESSQRIANSEIESLYARCIYLATRISAQQFHYLIRISKYDTLVDFYNSTLLLLLAYLCVLQARVRNEYC
jgi:hypothetical protein